MSEQKPWHSKPLDEGALAQLTSLDDDQERTKRWFETQAELWLKEQVKTGPLYLLAHDDDGVIWGRFDDAGKLHLPGNLFAQEGFVSAPLRAITLQQARLFGPAGELMVWRGEGGRWRGRVLTDNPDGRGDRIEETHWLWGTSTHPPGPQDGFTLMRDGQQGLEHAVPIPLPDPEQNGRRVALKVCHYFAYDNHEQAYIALSRLVNIEPL